MLLSDELLLNYKRCNRRVFLNHYGERLNQDPERDFLLKIRQESQKHTQKVLEQFYPVYHQPSENYRDWNGRFDETKRLMEQGADCIYRGVLLTSEHQDWLSEDNLGEEITFRGTPDLLVKQPGYSQFGDWQYTPVNIQFGRRPKPEYKLIAAFHGLLLASVQGVLPSHSKIILRRYDRYRVNLKTWIPQVQSVINECLQMLLEQEEPEVFISRQRCNFCRWYSQCYAIASSQKHLSLVPGVTPSRYQSLLSLGVETVESLAEACSIYMGEVLGFGVATRLKQQAEAIVQDCAIVKPSRSIPQIPTAPIELYFDIEAEPERNLDYLLGVLLVDHRAKSEQFTAFLAEAPEAQAQIWQQFLAFVSSYPDAPIFHYSEYEVDTIRRLGALYNTPTQITEQLLARFVDIHHAVVTSVVLPVESYSLKSLANWLGFGWRDSQASGEQSVCWYDQWMKSGDHALLEAILRYNEDDCRATYVLKDWLVNLLEQVN